MDRPPPRASWSPRTNTSWCSAGPARPDDGWPPPLTHIGRCASGPAGHAAVRLGRPRRRGPRAARRRRGLRLLLPRPRLPRAAVDGRGLRRGRGPASAASSCCRAAARRGRAGRGGREGGRRRVDGAAGELFTQNFSEHFLLEPVPRRRDRPAGRRVAEPFVDVEDVADVAVAALTEDGHNGQLRGHRAPPAGVRRYRRRTQRGHRPRDPTCR